MGDERYNELRIAIAEFEAARQKVRAVFERLVADELVERLLVQADPARTVGVATAQRQVIDSTRTFTTKGPVE